MPLFKNIRFYVVTWSILLSLGIYVYIVKTIPEGSLQIIKLTQIYALTAISYLYLALLATPLTRTFTQLPFRGYYVKARRAIGVSAFYFALLHACFAFFGQLGGFGGLPFLGNTYLIAISLSFTALIILSLMAATSFEFMITKLTFKRWKFLHRFVYLASIFLIIHALMLGTHFANINGAIPQIAFILLSFLFILEAIRFDKYLATKFITLPKLGPALVIIIVCILASFMYLFNTQGVNTILGIHGAHIQLAKEAQQQSNQNTANLPSYLQGDKTKRFTVNFDHPQNISSNKDATLRFTIFDASSGNKIALFKTIFEKPMHLIIVDESLTYFTHIHPTQIGENFEITAQFPKDGKYHVYIDFQPVGAIEQQFAFTIDIGTGTAEILKTQPDQNLTKVFGNYEVTLAVPTNLNATEMTLGGQKLAFTIKDAKEKKDITTLKPYLAAFGHLVMINKDSYEYIHVHPTNVIAPNPDENGGPTVEFLPLGIYGPIKPGVYRVFAQFNPDGNLFTADFTVEVK
jgi:DMSO/TMAO reductase YedYZ heme-binding membrane subunit